MITTELQKMFTETFHRDDVLQLAREVEALLRLRDIHPADFCLALTSCAMGDETRSIATARRMYSAITGHTPEESSFYDRFNKGLVALLKRMFEQAVTTLPWHQREALAATLEGTGLVEMAAVDASQITLPASAKEVFPSTSPEHGGVKLTATLSVLYQRISKVTVSTARPHDRKVLKLSRWLHETLLLLDRGYADHGLWASIEDRKGYFLTPLKSSEMPLITAIRTGLGKSHIGKRLDGGLPYRGTVDVDAAFKLRNGEHRIFRVLRVPVCHVLSDGSWELMDLWFVTNLPVQWFSPEQIAILYRFRWEVEQLFRTLKMVGRLDHLRSANSNVIHAFIYATLLGMVLAQNICALMRRNRPGVEPSPFRVAALLLRYLPSIIEALGTRHQKHVLQAFENALWREGINPNPGRPYRSTMYIEDLAFAA